MLHNCLTIHSPAGSKPPVQRISETLKSGGCFSARETSKEDSTARATTHLDDSSGVQRFFRSSEKPAAHSKPDPPRNDIAWKLKKIIEETKKDCKASLRTVIGSGGSLRSKAAGKKPDYMTQTLVQPGQSPEHCSTSRKSEGSMSIVQSPQSPAQPHRNRQQHATDKKTKLVFTPPAEVSPAKKAVARHDSSTANKPKRRASHNDRDKGNNSNSNTLSQTNTRLRMVANCSASTATNISEKPQTLPKPSQTDELKAQLRTLKEKTQRVLGVYRQREGKLVEANRRLRVQNVALKKQLASRDVAV